jgi:hypothetical protein
MIVVLNPMSNIQKKSEWVTDLKCYCPIVGLVTNLYVQLDHLLMGRGGSTLTQTWI